jgi:hypothetical protein
MILKNYHKCDLRKITMIFISLIVEHLENYLILFFMHTIHDIRNLKFYLTTITGHDEYVTTPEAVLPSNSFLIPDRPLVPITIKSTSLSSA